VLLVHPGGPFWARRDERAWSIPKGEYEDSEDALAAARREFAEELGREPPRGDAIDLGTVTQKNGKRVHAWALEGDLDVSQITSNTFELEWPPRSGTRARFPEVDRAGWFGLAAASTKLVAAQAELVDRLARHLAMRGPRSRGPR
jgi:predicted NUDIX family NTP pyrophosphohydrolase